MADKGQNLKKSKLIPLLWIIIVILIVVIVIVYFKCPSWGTSKTGSTAPKPKVEVILEDSHSAVWMVFDNRWTESPGTPFTRWEGVVFQMGEFFQYNSTTGTREQVLETEEIKFENAAGNPVRLAAGDFDWINIIPTSSGWQDPIPPGEGYALFPNPHGLTTTACDPVDECILAQLPPPIANCTDEIKKLPQPCARNRSLRARFEPYAVVTCWVGPNGYEMNAGYQASGSKHGTFNFGWLDGIDTVEVYLGGVRQTTLENDIAGLGTITKITFKEPSDVPHGDMDEPPMSLKKFGP